MFPFLALLDSEHVDEDLLVAVSRVAPVIASRLTPGSTPRYLLVEDSTSTDVNQIITHLDNGADKAIVPLSLAKSLLVTVPAHRLLLLLDVANVSAVSDSVRNAVSGVLLKTSASSGFGPDLDLIRTVSRFFIGAAVHVLAPSLPSPSIIKKLAAIGASVVIPFSQLTLGSTSQNVISVADAFLAPIVSDRSDGLFPTVVSSDPNGQRSLGLVYSSRESVAESIRTGKGVYHSRKHGLWRKGETSGATQDVVRIRVDCDSDALEFSVVQHGAGFCHLNRASCFGDLDGLAALQRTLASRLVDAPEGSYTRRLFNDGELLRSKIMEEADELCRAKTKEEVAFEAADLIYFTLTRCVAAGVSVKDIERSLDKKAMKISRRPGNAKPQWMPKTGSSQVESSKAEAPRAAPSSKAPLDRNAPIQMRTVDISAVSPKERAKLLKRPVLRSDEMIAKVKPIVDNVRARGDSALRELTAKFDKAQLDTPLLLPPFYPLAPEAQQIDPAVRDAIDAAYSNVYKFHAAQIDGAPLVVETMPGVTCTRFARPIARVGLYVPGGTAVLPSTALMLGVPAQVAGCEKIVIATPPRADGSISPEVLYVAHKVGAHAILRAGGAQAVAALAYGTETVPKADKIFGPGNQWVTAAKMLVQNDTDAMVSIDMPAGPSEVLVIADETCNPAFVAADLLSQAEHGIDSQVVLVASSLPETMLAQVEEEVDKQARTLGRVDIVRESVAKSLIVKTQSPETALEFSNDYAPEHLILHLKDALSWVDHVKNAGSVFVGPYSPESCGDYASGTNHTLPTNGYARQFSGVNTQSFQKHITSQEVTMDGLQTLGPIVATLADCEGLQAHANAVRIRLGM
ncbi:histidine biosynthesis trifunctional-protein [Suillus paluster]|uniref:histidine biosynthesis trifunctional-protein n=1 Tax=Suillus paluster TaxID=48578 RepID=UPI001B873245|nr:histidine biosynthesis trifunctional-protein [Suillus paluster]KAG1752717.1 histidine biosynthesis trifunctional-protein [Suillus paluster]